MKKLLLVLLLIFICCGCTNNTECTLKEDSNYYTINMKYSGSKMEKITIENKTVYNTTEEVKDAIEICKKLKEETKGMTGYQYKYKTDDKKVIETMDVDFKKIIPFNASKLSFAYQKDDKYIFYTYDELVKRFEKNGYSCK